jgi:hypothetical protein
MIYLENPTFYHQSLNSLPTNSFLSRAIELKADSNVEAIWESQKQIAQVFDVTPQNITIHLKQIFTSGELEEKSKRFAF